MRKIPAICAMALGLAACGGTKEPVAEERSNAVETVNVVEETVTENGSDTVLPPSGAAAPGVVASPEQRALAETIKTVPEEKRRRLAALLECEEAKVPGGVAVADRPAFMKRTEAQLDADPMAIKTCRDAGGAAQPTE